MALSHHPRDGRTSVKTMGEGICNWLCRPHFTDWKERAGNLMQMCPPKLSLPASCAIADGVEFVCVVWSVCVSIQMCSWELGSIFVIIILSIILYWLHTKTSSFN